MLAGASIIVSSFAAVAPAVGVEPGDVVAASELPALLRVAAETTTPAYDRDLFNHWIDADADGCNTRYEVLIEESTSPVEVGAGCTLTGGTWVSPYDGYNATTPAEIEIDHVIALAEAWRSGASGWTNEQRQAFANDLDVPYALNATSTASNQSKSDKDPAEWLPTNVQFVCEYVISWTLGKYRWSLGVDQAELAAITTQMIGDCGATPVTLPVVMAEPAPEVPPVDPGQTVIAPFPAGTTRLAGSNRYLTAITASQRFSPNVPAVFVATGSDFPDALSAAAAAALVGGPLLLTPTAALPAEVFAEVQRLVPKKIYVIGGTGAVSQSVALALNSIAPTERLAGVNRYATAAAVVSATFNNSVPSVVIATGRSFPDALAATGAAGATGAPVLLVDGASSLSVETAVALQRLAPAQIFIAGGMGAVSAAIEAQLGTYTNGPVVRLGGSTRYATATTINDAFFPAGTSTMFLATGTNFPDALAGAAMAGRLGAPLYITQPDCTPEVVHNSINRLGASQTVVMGGTSVVSNAAAANTRCVPPVVTPPPVTPPPVTPPPGPPANPGDTVNCTNFATWSQAQAWYLTYLPYYGDVAGLDGDDDGIACESLPGAP